MRLAFFIAAFFLLVPATDAAKVKVDGGRVTYKAAPGEANRVTVDRAGKRYVVKDAGAELAAGKGCTAVSPHEARCARDGNSPLLLDAGDGDDELSLSLSGAGADLLAGDGDDKITGGDGDDTLHGDGGRDELRGGRGRDILIDGDGQQPGIVPVAARPIDSDVIDGGAGPDAVTYLNRLQAVTVDLASGSGGEAGEGDRLTGIEAVAGGAGDDTLLGTSKPNALAGNAGNDTIDGRGGDDDLSFGEIIAFGLDGGFGNDTVAGGTGDDDVRGGEGTDSLSGGSGNDAVTSSGGGDAVDCGGGRDTAFPNAPDVLDRSCERVSSLMFGGLLRAYPMKVRSDGRMTFAYRCHPRSGCDVRLAVASGDDTAAHRFHVLAGRSARLTVRLAHRPHGRVRVGVELRHHRRAKPRRSTWAWTISLP